MTLTLIMLVFGIFAMPARAADMQSFTLSDRQGILIVGDIELNDDAQFQKLTSSIPKAMVFLDSDGGSVFSAIEIGKMIRRKGYGTAVINDASCNSACGLIWLAGTPRALSKSGRVGFHAAYSDRSGRKEESGVANAMVGRYLTQLQLPERAVIFATIASPEDLSWLTTNNYRSLGIDLTVTNDVELGKKPNKNSADAALWTTSGSWGIYVDQSLGNACFLASAFDNKTKLRVGIGDGRNSRFYFMLTNPAWKSLREGETFDLAFRFDRESPWDVPMAVVDMGGDHVLVSKFSDTTFWKEFITAQTLVITRTGRHVTSVSLAGSGSAVDELISCQKAQAP